ncbi:MAG: M23 family metallopeptidase [Sphingomonadaceae bacterium]|nr:M23 family metallopeptidase [Sphingomonadaceae bacterium]
MGAAAALLCWTGCATVAGGADRDAASRTLAQKDAEIAALRGKVAMMQRDGVALRGAVAATVKRIETRQAQLAAMIGADKGRLILASAPEVTPPASGTDAVVEPLQRLEGQQLALIGQASSATVSRYQSAKALIRSLGLDFTRFARRSSQPAMGGPLEPVAERDGMVDLYTAWNSYSDLARAATSIPARIPVATFNYTSGFGVRYDPFNGGAAMHAGVDLAGPHGQPILAAADGVIVRAGWANGYGNMIEVDHGRGMTTRYGHLSRIQVKLGDRVRGGDQIGKLGSTGRSTGPHLHYEVRVDGNAVDPMPYLRSATEIAAVQSAAASSAAVGQGGPAVVAVAQPAGVRMSVIGGN